MKNLLLTLTTLFFFSLTQAQEFCPGNLFTNGDLEIGTPTGGDQDINNALGFSSIWASGSLADFYAYNAGPFPPPLPADGNYAGLWISNNPAATTVWREGLYNELNTPIANGSGIFSFTFDLACLYGWGTSELGVYGIYNPSNSFSATPTSSHSPSNENLYGPANTVLLGTAFLADSCDRYKTTQTLSFDSGAAAFPLGGITHILLTHSDDSISGSIYIGLDNFCMQLDSPAEDTCALVVAEEVSCDASGYTYTFSVQNNTGQVVDGIIVDGNYDPIVTIAPGATYGPITTTIPVGTASTYCFDLVLFSENQTCCHTSHCVELPFCDPCDSIDLVARSVDNSTNDCCYEVDVINNFEETYFSKIVSTIITPGVNFDSPSGDNGWTANPVASNVLNWTPSGTYIEAGTDPGVLNFCFQDVNQVDQSPQLVVFDWIITDAVGNDSIVCSDTLTFYCEPCLMIANESINCLSDGSYEYCFSITNNSDNAATQLFLDPYTPGGIVFAPNPLAISLAAYSTETYCVNLSGGSAGDIVAYKAILKNFNGDILNWCCVVDTFKVRLPECQTACPVVEDYLVECGEDLDGDGQTDYILDLYISGTGMITVSSGCGTVWPASMAVAGAGYYTFNISNTGACNPFPLTYFSMNTDQEICVEDQLEIPLPQCPPLQTDCICDEPFFDGVNAGFSFSFDCPNGTFTPLALEDCDKVYWLVEGDLAGESIGNASLTYEFPGIGSYKVCMRVVRTQADGTQCEQEFCRDVLIEQWCLIFEDAFLQSTLTAAPNPVSDVLQVSWDENQAPAQIKLQLFTSQGKEVLSVNQVNGQSGSISIDLAGLEGGIYLLRLQGKGFLPTPLRIVKVKE